MVFVTWSEVFGSCFLLLLQGIKKTPNITISDEPVLHL